jgi:hypothetical protein
MLITSGGGAPIRSLPDDDEIQKRLDSYRDEGFEVSNVANFFVHHYSIVDVDKAGLIVNTIGVDPDSARTYPILETIKIESR